MNHAEFVSVYDSSYDTRRIDENLGPFRGLLDNAIDWSCYYGAALFDHLQGEQSAPELTEDALKSYTHWVTHEGSAIEGTLSSDENHANPEALNTLAIYNFHPINAAMSRMWTPIIKGEWRSEQERRASIRISQSALALKGLQLFNDKLRCIDKMQDDGQNYFSKKNTGLRRSFEGRLSEIDAAIVLLGVAAGIPDSTVVPGPLQFEQNIQGRRRYNADYIWCNQTSALGIQVKSQMFDTEQIDYDYDPSRIVLVDCAIDLANEAWPLVDPRTGSRLRRPWSGLISAHHVLSLQTTRNGERELASIGIKSHQVEQAKLVARRALAGMKSMNDKGTHIIRDRVLYALAKNERDSKSGKTSPSSYQHNVPQARQAGQLATRSAIGRQGQHVRHKTLQES